MGRRFYFYLKKTRQCFRACSEVASELDAAEQLLRRRIRFVEPQESEYLVQGFRNSYRPDIILVFFFKESNGHT